MEEGGTDGRAEAGRGREGQEKGREGGGMGERNGGREGWARPISSGVTECLLIGRRPLSPDPEPVSCLQALLRLQARRLQLKFDHAAGEMTIEASDAEACTSLARRTAQQLDLETHELASPASRSRRGTP